MPDLKQTTTPKLLDRLDEIEARLDGDLTASDLTAVLREVAQINVELARRTATGWRPL